MAQGLAAEVDWFEPRALLWPLRWLAFPMAGAAMLFVVNPLSINWWGRWVVGLGMLACVLCAVGLWGGRRGIVRPVSLVGLGFFAAALLAWLLRAQIFACSVQYAGRPVAHVSCSWLPDTWLTVEIWALLAAFAVMTIFASGGSPRLMVGGLVLVLAGSVGGQLLGPHPASLHLLAEWSWDGTAPGASAVQQTGPAFVLGRGSWEVDYHYDCTQARDDHGHIHAEVLDPQRLATRSWAVPATGAFAGTGSGKRVYGPGTGRWQLVGDTSCRVDFAVNQ
jgi:hypothetical protein